MEGAGGVRHGLEADRQTVETDRQADRQAVETDRQTDRQ